MEMGIKFKQKIIYAVHNKCLICNSTELVELTKYSKNYLTQCRKCAFVFCKRIPTQNELILHYKEYQRGSAISPITIKRYHQLLDEFEPYRKTNNILDVGCGDGYFLEEAKKRGWNVFGTEFSDEAIEVLKSKKIQFKQGKLNSDNYIAESFDIITSFEVIEHINNPQNEVVCIKKILRNGGLFYFTTPNFNSISRIILKSNWSVIEYPEHLSYYTSSSISRLLYSNGFSKIKTQTTGLNLSRLKKKQNNSFNNSIDKKEIENLREKTETYVFFKILKSAINSVLDLTKMGDTLKGYFIKK